MISMVRGIVLASLLTIVPRVAAAQEPSVLHIKIVLIDAQQKPIPVAHHMLLISDNPSSAAPRQVVTAADGTADVRLRPGNYTVESDQPVAFGGKAYGWTRTLDIVAGRDAVLELTAANADVEAIDPAKPNAVTTLDSDPWLLLTQWQDSVVGLWTPTTHASGFVIDANGFVVTSQRALGGSTAVEVQITPSVKVVAKIVAADAAKDVAVLWVDATAVASVRPVPLACEAQTNVANGQKIFAIVAPLLQQKGTETGTASRVDAHGFVSDLALESGGTGGPVFTAGGSLIGMTAVLEDGADRNRRDSRVVRLGDLCEVVASAQQKIRGAAPPERARLPVEPAAPFPVDALKNAAQTRAGSLNPYQAASADFDVAFMTPVQISGARYQFEQATRQGRGASARPTVAQQLILRTVADFGNWSEYVESDPPVLFVRATPKMVESFWTKFARGAAQTQGVAIPAIKHFKSGFLKMRALCGDAEVTPIHPFIVEQGISESETIAEGLYVFDPAALAPTCGTVKLVLYTAKAPEKADTLVVDPKILEQIWRDFAPYRDPK